MRARISVLFVASALLSLLPVPAASQVFTGRVLDQTNDTPVQAALVELLDEEGERVAVTLSGTRGEWTLRPPAVGTYHVQVSRLGYRTSDVGPLVFAARTVEQDIYMEAQPIRLASLVAQGRARCVVNPANAPMTAMLWDEAAKSLEVAAVVNEQELISYEVAWFRRTLEPDRSALVEEELGVRMLSRPFWSPPPAELMADGFVREEGDSVTYYMPHPSVVLSRDFLDGHCFHIARRSGPEGRFVGLAFEPLDTRRRAGVAGTLWLDEATAELASLEYEYVGLEDSDEDAVAGGAAEFEQLGTGLWVVRRWYIRAPLLAETSRMLGLLRGTDLRAVVEEGGELLRAADRYGRIVTRSPDGVLSGMVYDSVHGKPLGGAKIRLVGTPHTATAAADGTFRVEGLPPGAYVATFHHPLLDTLTIHWPVRDVQVPLGEDPLLLAVPSRATVLRTACPGVREGDLAASGILSGYVFDSSSGDPLPGFTVAVSTTGRYKRSGTGVTDEGGFFRVCGVPVGSTLEVEAMDDAGRGATATLELSEPGFVRVDLPVGGGG